METATAELPLEDRWTALRFGVRRSIRYHQRRRAFFDRLDLFSSMLAVIFGSAAVYGVLREETRVPVALIASALVTIFASINLVVGSSRRAREHADFARQFVEVEKLMLAPASEDAYREIASLRLSIEAEEPPVLRVLDCLCHNEQLRSEGYSRDMEAKIGPLQRLFAQLFDWRLSAIK